MLSRRFLLLVNKRDQTHSVLTVDPSRHVETTRTDSSEYVNPTRPPVVDVGPGSTHRDEVYGE